AESGKKWGNNELEAFNITIEDAPIPAFFETQNLPPSRFADSAIWNNEREPPKDTGISELESGLYFYMKFAEEEAGLETGAFTWFLLRLFGFTSKYRRVRQRPSMHFMMSGKRVNASADVTLVGIEDFLLVVQKDKLHQSSENPEAQLIAATIAAFYENRERLRCVGRPAPTQQVLFGITMAGTAPIFYRVLVTEKLLRALEHGPYPEEETVVLRFVPPVPTMNSYLTSGMRPLENRRIVFRCFERLEALIVSLHTAYYIHY
ncbi:hypothetical protein AN958_09584, partial [Leucoagaricus sp. SymC.cos]